MQKQITTISGVLAAMLLVATPVLAQDQRPDAAKQPSPSSKPVPEAKTGAVDPGAVGKAPSAGQRSTGTAEASPSQKPASQATPRAVEAEQGKSETR